MGRRDEVLFSSRHPETLKPLVSNPIPSRDGPPGARSAEEGAGAADVELLPGAPVARAGDRLAVVPILTLVGFSHSFSRAPKGSVLTTLLYRLKAGWGFDVQAKNSVTAKVTSGKASGDTAWPGR